MAGERPIRLGLVGVGKIARDQHVPAIGADARFELVASASRNARLEGLPVYSDIAAMIAGPERLGAVSLCTPPAGRHAIAAAAIEAGLHVMLEKPPTATLSEIADLRIRAQGAGVALFATWHSRAAAGVEPARAWLAERRIEAVRIVWKEDIRRWHPGQDWILAAGGFGVFDPGINALSILTRILPAAVVLDSAVLDVPAGRQSPIAATMRAHAGAAPVEIAFDFLQTGPQRWDVEVDTDAGTLTLAMGGRVLTLPGAAPVEGVDAEYPTLYRRFADLIDGRKIDLDVTPLRLVADAYLIGVRREVEAFEW